MLITIEKVAILKSIEIFADTPDYVLASLANIAEEIDIPKGDTFILEGALEDEMFIVVEGEVRVHIDKETVATLGNGEIVGEMEIFDPAPRLASVTATQDCLLFRIEKDAFEDVMADRIEITQNIIRVLTRRLRATTGGN